MLFRSPVMTYSGLMPAALTTRANFCDSAFSIAPYCSGFDTKISRPCAATFSRKSGIARIFAISEERRSTTAFGVPP